MKSIDRIKPLAKCLEMKVQSEYSAEQYKELAEYIMTNKRFDGKFIIIFFQYNHIPLLAHAMGISQAPHGWPEVFDRAWVIQ